MMSDHTSFPFGISLSSFSDGQLNNAAIHILEDTLDQVDAKLLALQVNQVTPLLLDAATDAEFWALCPKREHNDTESVIVQGAEIKGQKLSEFEKQFNIQTNVDDNEEAEVFLTARVSHQIGGDKPDAPKNIVDLSQITSLRDISRMLFNLGGNSTLVSFMSYRKDIPMELEIRKWEYDSNEGDSDLIATVTKNDVEWTFYQRKADCPLAVLGMESDKVDVRCIISGGQKQIIRSEEDCEKWLESFPISFVETMMNQILIANESN